MLSNPALIPSGTGFGDFCWEWGLKVRTNAIGTMSAAREEGRIFWRILMGASLDCLLPRGVGGRRGEDKRLSF